PDGCQGAIPHPQAFHVHDEHLISSAVELAVNVEFASPVDGDSQQPLIGIRGIDKRHVFEVLAAGRRDLRDEGEQPPSGMHETSTKTPRRYWGSSQTRQSCSCVLGLL